MSTNNNASEEARDADAQSSNQPLTDGGTSENGASGGTDDPEGKQYVARVGKDPHRYEDPIQTAETLLSDANKDPSKHSLVLEGTEETYMGEDPIDLSANGVERFIVNTRTDGNSAT